MVNNYLLLKVITVRQELIATITTSCELQVTLFRAYDAVIVKPSDLATVQFPDLHLIVRKAVVKKCFSAFLLHCPSVRVDASTSTHVEEPSTRISSTPLLPRVFLVALDGLEVLLVAS